MASEMAYGQGTNPLLEPFWEGARASRLLVQGCRQCGHVRFPPTSVCPRCLSPDQEWREVSGRARVESVVTFHQRYWDDRPTPYDVYLVELEEGPLMMSGTVDGFAKPRVGDSVQVIFERRPNGVVLPQFVCSGEIVAPTTGRAV